MKFNPFSSLVFLISFIITFQSLCIKSFQLSLSLYLGSEEKLVACSKYGADVTVNYKTTDFAEEVLRVTKKKGRPALLARER